MSKESKHTPGPWRNGDVSGYGQTPGCIIADDGTKYNRMMKIARIESGNGQMSAQNAKLIAAAPDLLEACEKTLNALNNCRLSHEPEGETEQMLRAVIAKARGEQ
jgi:hypothetical protein